MLHSAGFYAIPSNPFSILLLPFLFGGYVLSRTICLLLCSFDGPRFYETSHKLQILWAGSSSVHFKQSKRRERARASARSTLSFSSMSFCSSFPSDRNCASSLSRTSSQSLLAPSATSASPSSSTSLLCFSSSTASAAVSTSAIFFSSEEDWWFPPPADVPVQGTGDLTEPGCRWPTCFFGNSLVENAFPQILQTRAVTDATVAHGFAVCGAGKMLGIFGAPCSCCCC